MSDIAPPNLTFQSGQFVVEPGPDFSHLQQNLLRHIELLPRLAESCDPPYVNLNMNHVQFMGSAFIGQLVASSQTLQQRGGKLSLTNLNKFCLSVLKAANLDTILCVD